MAEKWRSPQFVISVVLLTVAILMALRIGAAALYLDQHTLQAALRARTLAPEDEAVYLRLASLDKSKRATYLQDAAERNPRDPEPWISLGLMAEMNNEPGQAEHFFQQARLVDAGAEPAWMLANYYFQQGDLRSFHAWGQQYRRYANGDASGLFRMEWSRTHSVPQLLDSFDPLTCDELTNMAAFLDMRAPAIDAVSLDNQLASCPGPESARAAMTGVSRLLEADQVNDAMLLWNRLSHRSDFAYAALNPATGAILTNADFAHEVNEMGFNWRVNRTPGVSVRRAPQALELKFDGREPQGSILLFEPVVLAAHTTYELSWRLHSEDTGTDGFGWRLMELTTGKTVDVERADAGQREGDKATWSFQAPESARTLVLAFGYVRQPGHTNALGKLVLSDVKLRPTAGGLRETAKD
jgi:hypothetical protein